MEQSEIEMRRTTEGGAPVIACYDSGKAAIWLEIPGDNR